MYTIFCCLECKVLFKHDSKTRPKIWLIMKKYCVFTTFSRTICQYLILAITLIGIQPTAILTYGDLSNNSKNSKF